MDDIILQAFPRNEIEALAMLYVKNQNLSGLSPEEVLDMYLDARERIRDAYADKINSQYEQI